MGATVELAGRRLPELVAMAREVHPDAPLPKLRQVVLGMWVNLAGVIGWTPAMVEAVEEATRR